MQRSTNSSGMLRLLLVGFALSAAVIATGAPSSADPVGDPPPPPAPVCPAAGPAPSPTTVTVTATYTPPPIPTFKPTLMPYPGSAS